MQLYAVNCEPSSGIKLTAYSCICWLFHRIYYDAWNRKRKIIFLSLVLREKSLTIVKEVLRKGILSFMEKYISFSSKNNYLIKN